MSTASTKFEYLATREGFNDSLSHFRAVSTLIEDFENYNNLADLLVELLENNEIASEQILPIVSALLLDKYKYKTTSYTLEETLTDFSHIYERAREWDAVDIVMVYFHPDLGPLAMNPKNEKHFASLNNMRENELVTIYTGFFADEGDEKIQDQATKSLIKLLQGKKIKTPDSLTGGKYGRKKTAAKKETKKKAAAKTGGKGGAKKSSQKTAEQRPAAEEEKKEGGGKRRMTPFYSIMVTNELFHNGNVEAWKKIIQSYKAKHPGLEVYVYYEGERIQDIHSLFKWGKVKHGSSILIAVAGEDIKDVAKLRRYLQQGASPQFESFLKFPVNKTLNLF